MASESVQNHPKTPQIQGVGCTKFTVALAMASFSAFYIGTVFLGLKSHGNRHFLKNVKKTNNEGTEMQQNRSCTLQTLAALL